MERISIKNYGPIKDIDIEIKDINIFIGETAGGKSTVAKILSAIKDENVLIARQINSFLSNLRDFNCDYRFQGNTIIEYESDFGLCRIANNELISSFPPHAVLTGGENSSDMDRNGFTHKIIETDLTFLDSIVYIPAERSLISVVAESLFGLLRNNISLSRSIIEFGSKFEKARRSIKKLKIECIGTGYEFKEGSNILLLADNSIIKLENSSSGFQSLIPMFLVLEDNIKDHEGNRICSIIEEPELNLYPSTQKKLIEYVIEKRNSSKSKLIITTHSPYVLTTIDNLIQANNVAERGKQYAEKSSAVINSKYWIDYNSVACYFFKDGKCFSTLDNETKTIGASNIDDISIELSEIFDKLVDLKYEH